jgi:hypothetical protein
VKNTRVWVLYGPGELGLVVIIRKSEGFFAKWPKRGCMTRAYLFSMGCGGEGKGEELLIILM